jgi:hypothetical protein
MLNNQLEEISNRLKTYRRRMVLHDAWVFTQENIWIPALSMLLLTIIGRIIPITNLSFLVLTPIGFYILILFVKIILIPKSNLRVAWRVDQNLALKERTSTTIALSLGQVSINAGSNILLNHQRIDSLDTLETLDPKLSFIPPLIYKKLILPLFLLLTAGILFSLPNPMDKVLREREEVAQAAANEAESLEELIEEINKEGQLSEVEKEELIRELEALAEQLKQSDGDRAEALEAISSAEQSLLEKLDPNADFKQSAMESITDQLSSLAKQATTYDNEFSEINAALAAITNELDTMSIEERQALSNSLQKMSAQSAQAGASGLSEAISSLGEAALNGSIENFQNAAQNAAQAAEQLESQLDAQKSLQSALAQLQESRTALSQANQSGNVASGQNNGQQGPGQGDQQGQDQGLNSGQGQGQGSTAGGGGGGSTADSLPPATGSGQAQDPGEEGQSGTAGVLGDQVYVPWERFDGSDDALSISGQDTGQGQTQTSEINQPLPGSTSQSIVPYQDVFKTYQSSAFETLEQSYIPPSLKDYIRAYFTQLEP